MGCKVSKQAVEDENEQCQAPGSFERTNEEPRATQTKAVGEKGNVEADSAAVATDVNKNEGSVTQGQRNGEKTAETVKTNSKPGHVVNAWDAPTGRVGRARQLDKMEHVPKGPATDELLEMEFDKEGIDLYSTAISDVARPPPDHRLTNGEPPHKTLAKDESEKFDPSKLIDIEKFKAANAPAASNKPHGSQHAVGSAAQGHPSGPSSSTNAPYSSAASSSQAGDLGSLQLVSPSLSDFYNEDEKELMASIEKDFPGPGSALPGAVE